MTKFISDAFSPSGIFAAHFDGYEERPQQVRLCEEIARTQADGEVLLAEAPCGSGKSLAYLVPAIEAARARGERTLVVTANIALQEQLVGKDLPMLQEMFRTPDDRPQFSFGLMKGRSNFLCKLKEESYHSEGFLDPAVREEIDRILKWAEETETGDVSELDFKPDWQSWSRFSTSKGECSGRKCPFYEECHYESAKRSAREADIVVTNYHLLFAHVQVYRAILPVAHADIKAKLMLEGASEPDAHQAAIEPAKKRASVVLPRFHHLILDEGHKGPDIARDCFGSRLTLRSLKGLVSPFKGTKYEAAMDQVQNEGERYFYALERHRASRSYGNWLERKSAAPCQDVVASLLDAQVSMDDLVQDLWAEAATATGKDKLKAARKASRAQSKAMGIRDAVQLVLEADRLDNDEVVFYLEETKGGAALARKPLYVDKVFTEWIFDKMADSTCILSATLATGSDFSFYQTEYGALPSRTLLVGTPFDFERQCMMIVPRTMPSPKSRAYRDRVVDHVREAIKLAEGRTLCLFTSYRNLYAVRDALGDCPYPLLVQGDAPRTQLIAQFKEVPNSVLLGTESFWAGVDVPGEALSCLVIDRLPFPVPTSPVFAKLCSLDPKGFFTQSIPRAVIQFKQGFGRLIRRKDDRGVVVALDTRIKDKPYGKTFMRSLPTPSKSLDMEAISDFLGTAS